MKDLPGKQTTEGDWKIMIIVDSHAHACGEYLSEDSIRQKLQRAGCDRIILTPGQYGSRTTYTLKNKTLRDPFADVVSGNNRVNRVFMKLMGTIKEIPKGNEYVYKLAGSMPDIVYQSYWITKDNAGRLDEDYERMKFVSVKLHQCWEDFRIEDGYFTKVSLWAENRGIPLFIHVYSKDEIRKLIGHIKHHPELKVVIGHLFCIEDFLVLPKDVISNVYFDLSNSYFVSKERFLLGVNVLGADHFLLGSDTPYGKNALENTIEMIRKSGISASDIDRICGLNAVRLYDLN